MQPVSSTTPLAPSVEKKNLVPKSFALPAAQHAWARFPQGAWREIRTTTETFNEAGAVVGRSVTTQQESLHSAFDERYALDVQASVEMVGKRINGKWINRVLQTATDSAGQIISSRRLKDRSLKIANRSVDCQVWEVTYSDDVGALVDRVYYSQKQFPYILRRETTSGTSSPDGAPPGDQVQSVVALEVPYLVDGEVFRCACLETNRQEEKGSSVRVSLVSEEVPGGEVAVWSTDYGPEGNRTRWSSQELVNHGQESPTDAQQSRRETRRARRLSR